MHRLLTGGAALYTAHTNADVAEHGVNESLARALGLVDAAVIDPVPAAGVDKIVTFVPHSHADDVRRALTEAGAGAIGAYDSCTFTVHGEGRFRPLDGATPSIGRVGEVEVVDEHRVEAVMPRSRRSAVVAALRAVHPYEEPAYDILELADPPAGEHACGHGRIGRLAAPTTLRGFAEQVADALQTTAGGVRVGRRPRPPGRAGRGRLRRRRLLPRRGPGPRRGRLRHLRPAPPPGRGVPRARRAVADRHPALGGGVDLAAGAAGQAAGRARRRRRRGRYGGGPRQHREHRPLDVPGRRLTPPPPHIRSRH